MEISALICTICGERKSVAQFSRKTQNRSGYRSQCKACVKQQAVEWERRPESRAIRSGIRARQTERGRNRMQRIKLANPCQVCGETEPACLQFHHIDPERKRFTIAEKMKNRTPRDWTLIEAEITRCASLCANCHAKLHAGVLENIELDPITLS